MEPRRHHYLPQFLLRGFASRSKGNDFYAWVFRAGDVPPFEANLKNLAQQRDFHGNPKDSPLENIISSHENKFAPVIEQLRLGIVEEAALPTIREFVAHLMIRTKNIRAGFAEAAQGFLEEFGESIPTSDRKKWKNRMKKAARKEWRDPKMRELLAHLPKDKRVLFKRMFEKKILETDFRPIVSVLFNSLLQNVNLDAAASTGHISALTREPAPPARIDSISHLYWQSAAHGPHSFILGDVGLFGRSQGDATFRNLANAQGLIEIVAVPISHSVCLFGTTANDPKLPPPSEVNQNSVQLSREFFLASENGQREMEWRMQLGKRAGLLSEADVSEIIGDIL